MFPVLILLVVLSFCLLVGLFYYRTRQRPAVFQDIVADPVFERLVWQGYGDGDWWQGDLSIEGARVTFLIGGSNAPDPMLVARAHSLVTMYASFHQALEQFLKQEAQRRPEAAATIEQLVLTRVALFPEGMEHDPEAYQGEFVLLRDRKQDLQQQGFEQEWRCDMHNGQFTNLRVWV